MRFSAWAVLAAAILLCGCATNYGSVGLTGGFTEKELEPNVWRIGYYGNGFTTPETVQTYWLYRCAEFTLEKGFNGFEIISNITLVQRRPTDVQVASSVPIFIPMDTAPKPYIEADIRLLKSPLTLRPGKVFDAAALKSQLEGPVKGKKCDMGNVCPHVHHYLYDEGTPPAAPTGSATPVPAPAPTPSQ